MPKGSEFIFMSARACVCVHVCVFTCVCVFVCACMSKNKPLFAVANLAFVCACVCACVFAYVSTVWGPTGYNQVQLRPTLAKQSQLGLTGAN